MDHQIKLARMDLELLAEVDDQGTRHGLNFDPLSLVGDVEAIDGAGEEQGDEVPVAMRRQAERLLRVGARRVVVDVEDDVAGADVALEVVRPDPHGLGQQLQQLHPHSSRQGGEVLDDTPQPLGRVQGFHYRK